MRRNSKSSCLTPEGRKIREFIQKRLPRIAENNDVFIPVLGPMGHGKSTFINGLLGKDAIRYAPVSGGMEGCTKECDLYPWVTPEGASLSTPRRVVLIDTPGFDSTNLSIGEIIQEVASCIQPLPNNPQINLAGAVLIMAASPRRWKVTSAAITHALGQSVKMVTVTTFWDLGDESAGARFEREVQRVIESMGLKAKVMATARFIRDHQIVPALPSNPIIAALLSGDCEERTVTDSAGEGPSNRPHLLRRLSFWARQTRQRGAAIDEDGEGLHDIGGMGRSPEGEVDLDRTGEDYVIVDERLPLPPRIPFTPSDSLTRSGHPSVDTLVASGRATPELETPQSVPEGGPNPNTHYASDFFPHVRHLVINGPLNIVNVMSHP